MDKIKHAAPMLVNLGAAMPQEANEKETPKGWVTLGEANSFPNYLIDLYYSSPVHSALTMSIAFMIAGKEIKNWTLSGAGYHWLLVDLSSLESWTQVG
jgi:hypothetical protein